MAIRDHSGHSALKEPMNHGKGFIASIDLLRSEGTQITDSNPDRLIGTLWSAICFKMMTRYTCVFLSHILAFYSQVYDHFLTNAHIYAHKKPIYMRYKQACGICGRRKSSYKRHRIIPSTKNPLMYDEAEK